MFSGEVRGQAAAGAAVLLAIIAGLLIMFIILIPPGERAELLGEQEGATTGATKTTSPVVSVKNLLNVNPGRVDYLAQQEVEHPLPVVNIFTKTEAKVLAEKPLVQVKRTSFAKESSTFLFSVPDVGATESVFIAFDVTAISGKLIVSFNGEEILAAEVASGSIDPIPIPQNLLRKENRVEFTVSSPGIAFWKTNGIILERIKAIADVTSLSAQSSKTIFLMSETEKRNMEKVVLKFQPQCEIGKTGKLQVVVNGNEIYNAIPDCELALVPIEFSPALIYQGENELVFRTEGGPYLLSHIVVKSELKDVDFPTYYFDLSNEDYQLLLDGKRKATLRMDFVDIVESKYGDLALNGKPLHFDTREAAISMDVTEDVVRGNNALKIKPRKTVEIRELRVDLRQ